MFVAGAPRPAENLAEPRRIALNGQAYTWQEFSDYYGNDAWQHWNDADLRAAVAHAKAELLNTRSAHQFMGKIVKNSISDQYCADVGMLRNIVTDSEDQNAEPVRVFIVSGHGTDFLDRVARTVRDDPGPECSLPRTCSLRLFNDLATCTSDPSSRAKLKTLVNDLHRECVAKMRQSDATVLEETKRHLDAYSRANSHDGEEPW